MVASGPPLPLHLVGNTAVRQRKHLKPTRVGDQRLVPAHEPVQPPGSGDPVRTRRDEQVVRVPQDQLIPKLGYLAGLQPPHGPLGGQWNKGRRLHRAVRRMKHAGARSSIAGRDLEPQPVRLEPHAISDLPVIASGWGMPRSWSAVGATSARMPWSRSSQSLGGDDQRHRVERVGGVGRAVGLEHVVAVAVVGGDDAGAADALDRRDHVAEAAVDLLDRLDGGGDDAGVTDHVRVGEVDDAEAVARPPTSARRRCRRRRGRSSRGLWS